MIPYQNLLNFVHYVYAQYVLQFVRKKNNLNHHNLMYYQVVVIVVQLKFDVKYDDYYLIENSGYDYDENVYVDCYCWVIGL